MVWWKFGKRSAPVNSYKPNPHRNQTRSGFFSDDSARFLAGWTNQSSSIDWYLTQDLRSMRARSRELVRRNPYGKRFVTAIKANIVGPQGVSVQAQSMRRGELDNSANTAIETAWRDWCAFHCDHAGRLDFVDLQNMALSCAGQDGEFIFQKIRGRKAGKYGFQLQGIDPELLDHNKNEITNNGGEIRLGVEYNKSKRIVRYHFREKDSVGSYDTGKSYAIAASEIIHGFVPEWPDQSRGIPWMHSGLETAKHMDKYDESAIVAARAGANAAVALTNRADQTGADDYEGDEDAGDGNTYENLEPGSVVDYGDKQVTEIDPTYPHQLYEPFSKQLLRRFSSGIGVSYHAISNDLSDVNFSSIRAGVLEDREIFKGLQNWFIRQFVRPVYEEWLVMGITSNAILISGVLPGRPIDEYLPAHYQPRRWAWVDPQKDSAANQSAIENRLKSRSQIMREQGDDPESTWREIQREEQMMESLNVAPIQTQPKGETNEQTQD